MCVELACEVAGVLAQLRFEQVGVTTGVVVDGRVGLQLGQRRPGFVVTVEVVQHLGDAQPGLLPRRAAGDAARSEEHTSELQSLMRISYAVFCLKKTKRTKTTNDHTQTSAH